MRGQQGADGFKVNGSVTGNSAAFFRARWVSGQNAVLGNTVSVMG
jgi:hypothetical protein